MNRRTLISVTAVIAAFSATSGAWADDLGSEGQVPITPAGGGIPGPKSSDNGGRVPVATIPDDSVFCPADMNKDKSVTYTDLFDYLSAFFSGAKEADVNRDGALTSGDIFTYIAHYVGGC